MAEITAYKTIDRVASELRGWSFVSMAVEADLQREVHHVLNALGYEHYREHRLDSRSRVDIFLPTSKIGIEVKVAGNPNEVMRQLQRYNECDQIEGVILITSRSRHTDMPKTLADKPVRVVFIGGIR